MENQIILKNNIIITTQDFKDFFNKGEFKFLIDWNGETVYLKNEEVYYNYLFYTSLVNNNVNNEPDQSPEQWEETEDNINNFITDNDILKAFVEAKGNFNVNAFSKDEALLKHVFLLLTAHYLVMDINMLNGGYSNFLMTSKSVGSVSASYGIPNKILDNPLFNYFAGTSFGMKYLSYLYTRAVGNVKVVKGTTLWC